MPLPSKGIPSLSPAANDLGLGDMLGDQVANETEEQRKRRMKEIADRNMMGPSGSPATLALFGGLNGLGG